MLFHPVCYVDVCLRVHFKAVVSRGAPLPSSKRLGGNLLETPAVGLPLPGVGTRGLAPQEGGLFLQESPVHTEVVTESTLAR